MKAFSVSILLCMVMITAAGKGPVKIGIAGLSHSHVIPLLQNLDREDIHVVGIAEADTALAERYAELFGIDSKIIFSSLDEMLEMTRPEGVVTFTSIFDHLKVTEACALRGIHVMVEKPLAVSIQHAQKMERLARRNNIMLLTNYETTWYPSNHEGLKMIEANDLGKLRKVIVYDGHQGPEEINVNKEFLDWLTHPQLNGGGAVTDFGCYGANLLTWILKGEKPQSVFANLKQYKPETYPDVDDDATIILSYPDMEAVINASWNWPFNRKDMHIYGTDGYLLIDDARHMRYRLKGEAAENTMVVSPDAIRFNDPFAYFAAAIRGYIEVKPTDLSSLENNLIVVEILEAAIESSKTGKEIKLK